MPERQTAPGWIPRFGGCGVSGTFLQIMRRINRLSAEVCFSGRMRSRRCPELPENDEKQQKGDTFFKRPPLDWHPVRGAASLSCPPGGKPASHQSLRKRRRQSMGRRRKRRTLTAMIQYKTLSICQAEMFMRSSTPSAESGSVCGWDVRPFAVRKTGRSSSPMACIGERSGTRGIIPENKPPESLSRNKKIFGGIPEGRSESMADKRKKNVDSHESERKQKMVAGAGIEPTTPRL